MAQNVTIAGNQYPDVPSVLIPKTGGGGNAIFADPSVVTAVAADVASGKYFLDSSGVLTQGTASGGGGASNLVTGTFTGTTTGAAMDVTLNYTGSGYPIAVMIYPSEGINNSTTGTFCNLLQRYATQMFSIVRYMTTEAPTYETSVDPKNQASGVIRYKSSTSNATTYSSQNIGTTVIFANRDASGTASTETVRMKSNTKMSVYIASTSYGFAANIEYTYRVLYSS